MKVNQQGNAAVTTGGIGESTKFSIAVNGKVFKGLSSSLYTNKPGSIVREVCSNAADSHIAAGKADVPFTVHLPNSIEPWFSVKDEGVGLSEDRVRNLYTIYGVSTKDQSNDEIGGFGFGSKTPFAYTDQFTVTSIYNGEKKVYTAMIGCDGEPSITLVYVSETTEHNGVEVHLPIEPEDFNRFTNEVFTQLLFFKVKPIILNNFKGLEFSNCYDPKIISMQLDGFTFLSPQNIIPSSLFVVIGGVHYPVELSSLGYAYNEETEFKALIKYGAYLEVPIGKVDVILSREGIEYTKETIKFFRDKIDQVKSNISDALFAKIQGISDYWEKAQAFNMLASSLRDLLSNHPQFDSLWIDPIYVFSMGFANISLEFLKNTNLKFLSVSFTRESSKKSIRMHETNITFDKNRILIVKNKALGLKKRLVKFLREREVKAVTLIEDVSDGTLDLSVEQVIQKLGNTNCEVMLASELPKVDKVVRERTTRAPNTSCKKYVGYDNWEFVNDISTIPVAVYTLRNYNRVEESREFIQLKNVWQKLGYPLVSVNPSTLKKIEEGKLCQNWLTPKQAFDTLVEQEQKFVKMQRTMQKSLAIIEAMRSCAGTHYIFDFEEKYPGELNYSFLKSYRKIKDYIEETKLKLIGCVLTYNYYRNVPDSIKEHTEQFMQEFSLLPYIRNIWTRDTESTTKEVEKYIRLIVKNT